MSHKLPKVKEIVITNRNLEKIPSIKALVGYGHTFRLAKECPEGYTLYLEETTKGYFKLYNYRHTAYVYQKKLGYGRDTATAG